jgi:molybdate transport system regulatory protein
MVSTKPVPAFKLWFETEEGHLFGQGTFELLQKVNELGNLSRAAGSLEMSYRHAWGIVKKAEKRLGKPLIRTYRGGRSGGGGAELTSEGERLIREYRRVMEVFLSICSDDLSWEGLFVKISARNLIYGKVIAVDKGEVGATVKIEVKVPCVVTAFITKEAVEDLKIVEGDDVTAVIKATEVMVSKE